MNQGSSYVSDLWKVVDMRERGSKRDKVIYTCLMSQRDTTRLSCLSVFASKKRWLKCWSIEVFIEEMRK